MKSYRDKYNKVMVELLGYNKTLDDIAVAKDREANVVLTKDALQDIKNIIDEHIRLNDVSNNANHGYSTALIALSTTDPKLLRADLDEGVNLYNYATQKIMQIVEIEKELSQLTNLEDIGKAIEIPTICPEPVVCYDGYEPLKYLKNRLSQLIGLRAGTLMQVSSVYLTLLNEDLLALNLILSDTEVVTTKVNPDNFFVDI